MTAVKAQSMYIADNIAAVNLDELPKAIWSLLDAPHLC